MIKFSLSILARFFLVSSVVVLIGGLINSIFDTKIKLPIKHGPLELPTDFLMTFFVTFVLVLLFSVFWFLSDIRSSFKIIKQNIRISLALLGCVIITVIFIVTNIDTIQGINLHPYIYNNDIKGAEKIIYEGKVKTNHLNSALDTAIIHNKSAFIPLLLNAGAEVNVRSKILKVTPLMQAAVFGNFWIIETLIQYGADVNMIEESSGKNAAMMAVFSRNFYNDKQKNEDEVLKIIELFMEKGLSLKPKDSILGKNLLEMAIDEDYTKIVDYLKTQPQ